MLVQVLSLSVLTLFASLVGTVSGFGVSTIMIPVMGLFYPLPVSLLFVAVIHLSGDIWKVIFFKSGANWKLILLFGIPGLAFSYAGAVLSTGGSDVFMKRLLGGFILIYVVYLFLKQSWKIPANDKTSVIGGSLSGFFAGIFGVGGAVRGAFLSAFNLPKEMYIFTSGMIALFIDITRILRYLMHGTGLPGNLTWMLVLMIPLSFLGAFAAKKVIHRIPQKFFRPVIAALLGLVALKFVLLS
ncbi:sulfite exporter TauE/SafE family protein [bacterium]|nr:sulfite exporter TauE/SafE family protein [bacterium]